MLDEEGYLYVQDRVKDMIISGAENIYPREIEDVLLQHTAIGDAAAIGVPDENWGEAVKAVVVLRNGESAEEREIIEFCRERLASYKCPQSVDFTQALPRNPTGKVLKRELREPYWRVGTLPRKGISCAIGARAPAAGVGEGSPLELSRFDPSPTPAAGC